MTVSEITKLFTDELFLMSDKRLTDVFLSYMDTVDDKFFRVPASSTGKHHPDFALGEGGLLRHTKQVAKIANDLLNLEMYAPLSSFRDEIIVACLIHDTKKCGEPWGEFTVHEHPILAAKAFRMVAFGNLTNERMEMICDAVQCHMGQWNTGFRSKTELPKPKTKVAMFVHMCDYIASRKYMNYGI